MLVSRNTTRLTTSWYEKTTDTGELLNFRVCAPMRNNQNIVEAAIYRIDHTTSTCDSFCKSVERLKVKTEKIE